MFVLSCFWLLLLLLVQFTHRWRGPFNSRVSRCFPARLLVSAMLAGKEEGEDSGRHGGLHICRAIPPLRPSPPPRLLGECSFALTQVPGCILPRCHSQPPRPPLCASPCSACGHQVTVASGAVLEGRHCIFTGISLVPSTVPGTKGNTGVCLLTMKTTTRLTLESGKREMELLVR